MPVSRMYGRFIFSSCYIAISPISAIYLVICVSFLIFNTFPLMCDISELIKITYHEVVSSSCLCFCLINVSWLLSSEGRGTF